MHSTKVNLKFAHKGIVFSMSQTTSLVHTFVVQS